MKNIYGGGRRGRSAPPPPANTANPIAVHPTPPPVNRTYQQWWRLHRRPRPRRCLWCRARNRPPEPPAPRQHRLVALLSSAPPDHLHCWPSSRCCAFFFEIKPCCACWPSHLSIEINKKKFKPSILDNLHCEATSTYVYVEKLRLMLEDKRCSHWSPLDLMNQTTHPLRR